MRGAAECATHAQCTCTFVHCMYMYICAVRDEG